MTSADRLERRAARAERSAQRARRRADALQVAALNQRFDEQRRAWLLKRGTDLLR